MSLTTRNRPPVDPAAVAAHADALAARTRAEVERARALAELRREQAAADRAATIEAARLARQARRDRAHERAARRADRAAALRTRAGKLRPVLPLLVINGSAVYAQAAYAYNQVAPADWNTPSKLTLAAVFAVALESVALYVQWHAHDALLLKSYGTAGKLRRASWGIAGVVAAINYAHFAGPHATPTPAAVAFGLLSLLSPWLWGLHTRRAQHVQLLAEDAALIDDAGAQFSAERRRAFPIRSYLARRWSIDHGERDPRAAWAGYNTERNTRRAAPSGRVAAASAALRGAPPAPAVGKPSTATATANPTGNPTGQPPAEPRTATGTTTPGRARTGTPRTRRTGTRTATGARRRTDTDLTAALADVARDPDGTVPVRRAAAALGCGPDRARRLLAAQGLLRTDHPTPTPSPATA